MEIQVKDGEIQEEKCLGCENGCVLDDPYHGDDHKKKLRVKKDAKGGGGGGGGVCAYAVIGVSDHKPKYRQEYHGCENVVCRVVFGYENNTEYRSEEHTSELQSH